MWPGVCPGAVPHVKGQIADRHRIAILQPAVGLERLARNAVAHSVVFEPGDPETVFLLRAFDRHAEFAGKDSGRSEIF